MKNLYSFVSNVYIYTQKNIKVFYRVLKLSICRCKSLIKYRQTDVKKGYPTLGALYSNQILGRWGGFFIH